MDNAELIKRTRSEIERQIDDYYVFEMDRNPVACVALHFYPAEKKAELASLSVDPRYENQGIGGRLMQYVEGRARLGGAEHLIALSTQTFNYFLQKGGFTHGSPDDLPPARRERYDKSGRKSLVLVKKL
jgi:amino-acid N-acetyltransferase